jgi:hypothetical protein
MSIAQKHDGGSSQPSLGIEGRLQDLQAVQNLIERPSFTVKHRLHLLIILLEPPQGILVGNQPNPFLKASIIIRPTAVLETAFVLDHRSQQRGVRHGSSVDRGLGQLHQIGVITRLNVLIPVTYPV